MTPVSRFSLPVAALLATALANPITSSCTSTTLKPADDAPVPPATWQPTWTVTVHTATATATAAVDCGGCDKLLTDEIFINYRSPSGPSPMVVETLVAPEPTVVTVAHCKPTPRNRYEQDGSASQPPPQTSTVPGMPHHGPTSSCVKNIFHAPRFTHGPVSTVWTATETVTRKINCGGCEQLAVQTLPFGPGPVIFFSTTVTAATPTTVTVPACGGTGSEEVFGRVAMRTGGSTHYYEAPPFTQYTATPAGDAAPTCTTQAAAEPEVPNKTFTTYASTVTSTKSVDCGGCLLEWSTPVLNFFAPVIFTATSTATAPSTRVVLGCAAPTA